MENADAAAQYVHVLHRRLITSARLAGDRPSNETINSRRGSQHSANAVLTLETIEGAQEAHM
jgi:hypothetical protein